MLRLVVFHSKGKCRLFSFLPDETIHWHKEYKVSELQRLVGPGITSLDRPNSVVALPVPNKDAIIYSGSDIIVGSEKAVKLYNKCLKIHPYLEDKNPNNEKVQASLL